MVKTVKAAVGQVSKVLKNNRILMIVCVFVVMGLAVGLINYLQRQTLERFYVAYKLDGATELTQDELKNLHADCKHDQGSHFKTCGHVHAKDADAAKAVAAAAGSTNEYTVTDAGSFKAF
jgi:hypothetical protein